MAALELCSSIFTTLQAIIYEASKREEVYANQPESVCYLQISATQLFVYGNGKS